MGRIIPPKPIKATNGQPTGGVRGAKVQKQRKKHKVVLESAGDKGDDDKLRVVLSFHAEPPPGYTFIPAGNTQLTAAMKEFAKRGGHKIMAVSATPHAARHELSREVHRIGYHFPTEVVAQVCSHYGIRLDSSGRLVGEQESEKLFMKISQKGEVVLNENVRDQVTINTEAKEIIRDLFPKIPDNDLFSIIKTAFQLGQNKVGTADEIPLVRRAQLSVVAHIRHTYTSYDRLLRQVNYNDARHAVEKETLIKLVEWRGDENDKSAESRRAVDDIVREVVVLSDEDDSESELEEGQVVEDSGKKARPTPKPKPTVLTTEHRPLSPADLSPDEETPSSYRLVPQPRKEILAQQPPDSLARQQSRYAIWDQVRHEYHSSIPSQQNTQVIARVPLDDPIVTRPLPLSREATYSLPQPVRYVLGDPPPVRIVRQPSPPPVFRDANGRFYEKLPSRTIENAQPRRTYTPPQSHTFTSGQQYPRRSASPRNIRPQYHRRTPSMNDDGTIIQSIESPGMYQNQLLPDISTRQHPDDRRVQESRPLIDLTSTAEQANHRRSLSRTPPRTSFQERQHNELRAPVDSNPPHRRQLIELDSDMPSPQSTYQVDSVRRPVANEQYVLQPSRRAYVDGPGYEPEIVRLPVQYSVPAERRVFYEPVTERPTANEPVRYVQQSTVPLSHNDRNVLAYRANAVQPTNRIPPQQYVQYEEAPRRIIVLDTPDPMEGVQRTGNSRYYTQYPPRAHH